jgi:hypothetical protein
LPRIGRSAGTRRAENGRAVHPGKEGSLVKGIRQAVGAKQHLLDVIVQSKLQEMTAAYRGDSMRVKKFPEWPDMRQVFSAVVSFEDEGLQLLLASLTETIIDFRKKHPPFAFPEKLTPLGVVRVPRPDESLHKKRNPDVKTQPAEASQPPSA